MMILVGWVPLPWTTSTGTLSEPIKLTVEASILEFFPETHPLSLHCAKRIEIRI